MKKSVSSLILIIYMALSASAQDYREIIRNNPAWAASNLYQYVYAETEDTPAPKGFRPFYINHYGRHGSRYMSSGLETERVRPIFEAADSSGILTEAGRLFWKDLRAVLDEQDGAVGMLTARGAEEHRGMGERMARRFPAVFKGRKTINCISSTSPRCLLSMTYFTDALQDNTEGLDFSYMTGERYYAYLAYHPEVEEGLVLSGDLEMAFRRAESDPEALLEYFFTDIEKAIGLTGDPYVFERRLYQLACVGQLTDYGKCLLEHFPEELLVKNWEARNARFYTAYSNSKELPHYASEVAAPLVNEIVKQVDAALEEGSDVAADLSFGHDVTLMPLISHMGIDGMHEKLSFDEVNGKWNSSDFICMGSNIQFIFYRNKTGDVIVRILYNEKETTIPGLKSLYGPYYSWPELRSHLLNQR
jgi:hypothetical protein